MGDIALGDPVHIGVARQMEGRAARHHDPSRLDETGDEIGRVLEEPFAPIIGLLSGCWQ